MIPVANLYMMLAYAWNRLDQASVVDVAALHQQNLPSLLAHVLVTGVSHLTKRGLHKQYRELVEESGTLRGRVDTAASVKRALFQRARAVCQQDDYSADVIHNQIVKATLHRLVKCSDVAPPLCREAGRLVQRLPGVSDIDLTARAFRGAVVHRHTAVYAFLLDVCQMIYNETLPSEESGGFCFRDFTRDEKKMWRLFQDFVLNFYRKELSGFSVNASHVNWNIEPNAADGHLLPSMRTDVSLKSTSRHIILDTKYTAKIFQRHYQKKSFRSEHLYQLLTYVQQQAAYNAAQSMPAPEGILLYPLAAEAVETRYVISGHPLSIATVDLGQPWPQVRQRLISLILGEETAMPVYTA